MQIIIRKLFLFRNVISVLQPITRFKTYKAPFTEEFLVNPFSNLKIDCNFNIALQSLNVNKYINQDRVVINTICHKTTEIPVIDCEQIGDEITIKSSGVFADCLCIIEAPLKANFDVQLTGAGCVNVGSFENDYLRIKTESGNVELDKFQSGDITVATLSGDITCKKNTQAANISLKTKTGKIKTGKLQGRNLEIETDSGNVLTQASYCDNSCFRSRNGSFYLQNVHKSCKIFVEEGYVSLMVFDGVLELFLKSGKADLLLSRILGDSTICIEKEGILNLKIVDSCFDFTAFKFKTNEFKSSAKIDFFKNDNDFVIKPKSQQDNIVHINCDNVNVENVTVLELFRLLK